MGGECHGMYRKKPRKRHIVLDEDINRGVVVGDCGDKCLVALPVGNLLELAAGLDVTFSKCPMCGTCCRGHIFHCQEVAPDIGKRASDLTDRFALLFVTPVFCLIPEHDGCVAVEVFVRLDIGTSLVAVVEQCYLQFALCCLWCGRGDKPPGDERICK